MKIAIKTGSCSKAHENDDNILSSKVHDSKGISKFRSSWNHVEGIYIKCLLLICNVHLRVFCTN